jgi:PGF-CTERM protein
VQHHAARLNQSQVEYNNVTGIRFVAGGAGPNTIATTDIYGNGQALNISEADGALIADVKNNYWGASSGPFHESINPEGEGNQITGGLDTVEFLPYAESPFGTPNERPVASFEGESRNVTAGTEVTFSAAPSSDDSQIRWYSFAFNNSSDTGLIQSPSVTRTFQYEGTYRVNLSVIDDRGVPSETDATLTIRVNPAQSSDGTTKNNNNNNGGSNSGGQSGSSGTTTTETRVPGFGFGAALVALLATFVVGRRFSGR